MPGVVRPRSISPSSLGLRRERFSSAFCQSTSDLDVGAPHRATTIASAGIFLARSPAARRVEFLGGIRKGGGLIAAIAAGDCATVLYEQKDRARVFTR